MDLRVIHISSCLRNRLLSIIISILVLILLIPVNDALATYRNSGSYKAYVLSKKQRTQLNQLLNDREITNEVVNRRNSYSTTYKLDEKSKKNQYFTRIHTKPINTFVSGRGFLPIKNTIKKSSIPNYSYYSDESFLKVFFTGEDDVKKGTNNLFTVLKGNSSIQFSLNTASVKIPELKDNSIVYTEVLPGIDIKYSLSNNQIKEDIIFNKKPEKNEIRFNVKLNNVTFADGEKVKFKFDKQKFNLKLGEVFLKDSNGKENRNSKLHTSLIEGNDKEVQMTIQLDDAFLSAETTVYPITLDPTIEIEAANDFYIDDTGVKYFNNNLLVGNGVLNNSIVTYNSIMDFNLNSLPSNIEINSAVLTLCPNDKGNNPSPIIDIYNILSPWPEGSLFVPPPTLGNLQGSLDLTNFGNPGFNPNVILSNSLIESWLTNPLANNGLVFVERIPNTLQEPIPMSLTSSTGSCDLALEITYTEIDEDSIKLGNSRYETFYELQTTKFGATVNLKNGNLFISQNEYQPYPIKTTQYNPVISPFYNSRSSTVGWFGNKRISELESALYEISQFYSIKYIEPSGSIKLFEYDPIEEVYVDVDDSKNIIRFINGEYQLKIGYFQTLTFANDGRLLRSGNLGYSIQFNWAMVDTFFRITSITNPDNSTTLISYNVDGRVASIAYPDGSSTYTYTGNNLTNISSTKSNGFLFNWDSNNNISSVVDPLGSTFYYESSEYGKCLYSHDEGGLSESYYYYSNYSEVKNEDNTIEQFSFDENGLLIEKQRVYENSADVISFSYNANKEIILIEENPDLISEVEYIENNYPNNVVDFRGGTYSSTRTIQLDQNTGNITQMQITSSSPAITSSTLIYDNNGNTINAGVNNNLSTSIYDYTNPSFAKLSSFCSPMGRCLIFTYDLAGSLIKVSNSCENEVTIEYPANNKYKVISAEGRWVETELSNCCNQPIKVKDYFGETNFEYDANGNLVKTIDRDSSTKEYVVDIYGKVTGLDWEGKKYAYNYNTQGNLTSIYDERGKPQTRLTYNSRNLLVSIKDVFGNTKTIEYETDVGREKYPKKITDAFGRETNVHYFNEGLLDYANFEWVDQTIEYDYDFIGRITSITGDMGEIYYEYSTETGDLVKKIAPGNEFCVETNYNYDEDGLISSLFIKPSENFNLDYGGRKIEFDVNDCFDLTAIHDIYYNDDLEITNTINESFEYDRDHLLTFRDNLDISYEYDEIGRLSEISNPNHSDMNRVYTYNNMNKISNDTNWSYEYDIFGQLTNAERGNKELTFEYDSGGNRTKYIIRDGQNSETYLYEYDDMNRLTKTTYPDASTDEYFYCLPNTSINALNGPVKIEKKINDTIQATTVFEYNPLEFPKNISTYDSNDDLTSSTSMFYDAEGNRVSIGDRSFYYYKGLPISEFREGEEGTTNDDVLLNYLYYNTVPLLMEVNPVSGVSNIPSKNELFYNDKLGSVIGTIDDPNLNNPLKTKNEYYPFGEIEYSSGSSFNSLKFSGAYYEPTSKSFDSPPVDQLYSTGTRLYDSSKGRYLCSDQWGPGVLTDPWTLHSYHYCKNDPVNLKDPWGTDPKVSCEHLVEDIEHEISDLKEDISKLHQAQKDYTSSLIWFSVGCGLSIVAWIAAIFATYATAGAAAAAIAWAWGTMIIACAGSSMSITDNVAAEIESVINSCARISCILLEMNGIDPKTGEKSSDYPTCKNKYTSFTDWGVCKPTFGCEMDENKVKKYNSWWKHQNDAFKSQAKNFFGSGGSINLP